ncbi:MAG: HNH endonuclease signature motif containing protein [Bacteroidales bacterium]
MENRLPAETSGNLTRCIICTKMTGAINWHHTIPRSLGGTESLQIPVCGDCHTSLHSNALGVVAQISKPSKSNKSNATNKTYWSNPADQQRAKHWLQILVQALLLPPISVGDKKTLLPMIAVDSSTRQQLSLMQKDLQGVTNLEQLLLFCINYTLKNRGYKNGKEPQLNKGRSSKSINGRSHLW